LQYFESIRVEVLKSSRISKHRPYLGNADTSKGSKTRAISKQGTRHARRLFVLWTQSSIDTKSKPYVEATKRRSI